MNNLNSKRLIKYLSDFVSINSESGNESDFRNFLIQQLIKLGYDNYRVDNIGNLYIQIDGIGPKLMINTHLDTAKNGQNIRPQIKQINGEKYITSGGKTILGADPKATIAALFEVLSVLQENKFNNRNIELTFTCNEETGIPTASEIKSDAKYCIVPDRGTQLGEIIIEAPDAKVFTVEIQGKTAYATTSYKQGVDSIRASAEFIQTIVLGNISDETVTNLGIINGGEMPSMVCDRVVLRGSCYSFNRTESDNYFQNLNIVLSGIDKKYKTNSILNYDEHFPAFTTPEKSKIVKIVQQSISQVGIDPKIKKYLAVSNANLINQLGIPTVLISYGVENQHTVNERISVRNLEKLTEILMNIFRDS